MEETSLQSTNQGEVKPAGQNGRDAVLFVGFLVLMALLPVVFIPLTVDQFALPKFVALQVGTVLLIACWIISLLTASKFEFRRTSLDVLVVLFFVWILISTIFSLNATTSILGKYNRHEGVLTYAWYFLLFLLSVQVFRDKVRISLHIRVMVLVAVAVSIYGLLQYFNIDMFRWIVPVEGSVAGQSISTFGNRSFLGGFLAMVLPLALAVFFAETKTSRILLWGFFLLVVLVGLLGTFTRGAWIGAVLGLLLFLALTASAVIKKRKQLFFLAVMLLLLIVVGFAFGLGGEAMRLLGRVSSIFEPMAGSAAIRTEIWKSSLGVIAARPATGSGPDVFRLIFPRFQTLRFAQLKGGQSIADDAHSYPLHIAATLGLPALVIFLAIVFVVFRQGIRLARSEREENLQLLFSALLGGILAYLVHLLFTVSNIATTAWLWVIFGIVGSQVSSFQPRILFPERWHFVKKIALILGAIVILLLGTGLGLRIFLADFHAYRAQYFLELHNIERMGKEFEQSIRWNPYEDTYWREMGVAYFDYSRMTGDREVFEKTLYAAKQAVAMNQLDFENNLFLAQTYIIGGKEIYSGYFDDALESLNWSLELRPYCPISYYFLGEIHFVNGRMDEAIRYLEEALTIDPNFTRAQYLLRQAYKEREASTENQ